MTEPNIIPSLEVEPLEEQLLKAVADVLGLGRENISLLDSFLELGGDGEAATRLRRACMDEGMALTTKDILRCRTLAELQTCVMPCSRSPGSVDPYEPIPIAPREIRKTQGSPAPTEASKSRPRHSSNSSVSSNNQARAELEEVLSRHSLVSQVVVMNPKAGLLEGRTLAVLTLTSIEPMPNDTEEIRLVPSTQMLVASTQLATLRRAVEGSFGKASVPDTWVVLSQMPLTESGEVDRRRIRTWSQNINEDSYTRIMRLDSQNVLQAPSTDMERSVQRVVSKVLQLPQDHVGVNFTFPQLGGDEMTAKELVARCKHESIYITADEVLRNATLTDLATAASQRGGIVHRWDEERLEWFELSPMQQLYFRTPVGGDDQRRTLSKAAYRFNQSHLLRLTKPCLVEDIQAAVEAIVGHHPMLRCRFLNQEGKWSQRIMPDVTGSYSFSHHTVSSDEEVKLVVERSQAAMDIQNWPVFAVDYLQAHDGQQMLYLLAHRLVADLLSWRIIVHDLDELLANGSLLSHRSMPYHKWIELHQVAALEAEGEGSSLPMGLIDQSYWGLKDKPNAYEDAVETSFSISSELTSILQDTCNQVFQTDTADIYIACLMLSFAQTFADRPVPVVWVHEHGRDSLVEEADISETVGLLTSLAPLLEKVAGADNIVDVLRKIKDNRRMSSASGALQFASKLYTSSGKGASRLDDPLEVVFSYTGCMENLQRSNGILEQIFIPGQTLTSRTSDIGPTVGRLTMFEVNTVVEEGRAKVKFVYNRYSNHQDRISSWISNYEHLLLEAIGRLRYHAHGLTLSDVPYLDITYDGLKKLSKNCVDALRLSSVRDIEDIYPVTANQQRLLVAQAQRPDSNIIRTIVELVVPTGEAIDTSRLCLAWQFVAARHAALRTVFAESVTQTGLYDQIVLRKVSPEMLFIDAVPSDDPIDELSSLPDIDVMEAKPPHRLTICRTPLKTFLSLEISSVVCDVSFSCDLTRRRSNLVQAASVDTLLRDLWHGYCTRRTISAPVHFSYPDYIQMLKTTRQGRSLKYWTDLLATIRPCMFPNLTSRSVDGQVSFVHTELDVASSELAAFATSQRVTEEAIARLAWALVLRAYTGDNDTCFGCSTSGRERFVDGLTEAVGSFANTVPCAVRLQPNESVGSSLQTVDEQLKNSLLHQFVSIPEVEHAIGIKGGTHLFNSWISYTGEPPEQDRSITQSDLQLKPVEKHHCTSYDVSFHIRHLNGRLVLDGASRLFPEKQTVSVANAFGAAVRAIISYVDSSVGDISLFNDRDFAQIVAWGNDQTTDLTPRDKTVVHDLVTRHAFQNPTSQAVCAWDGDLTYQQLVGAATTLAHYLVESGVGPHAVVPVVLEKSRRAPVALLAVLITGAAFVSLDVEELDSTQAVFDQLDAKVVITAGQAATVLGNLFEKVIVLNDSLFLQMPEYNESLPSIATPDDTACIIVSPTSTNAARGIAFSHSALSTAFLTQGPALRITPKSRVMQVSSLNSDIALSEIFTTLSHGGCVCIPSSIERLQNYTADVQRMRVTWSYMTPLLLRRLDPVQLPTLKAVCFRTQSLDEDTYSAWAGKVNVVLAYGAPDVCPLGISFLNVVGPGDLKSIGRPLAGNFWIVDPEDHRKLMPVGAVGELIIEGPTLGHTYPGLQTGDETHRELELHGGRRTQNFKTGHHRVRYLEDGVLQFVPSKRDDIQIDGHAVDLTQIEMHIRRTLGHGVDVMVEAIVFQGAKAVPVLAAFVGLGERVFYGGDDLANPSPAIIETVHMVKQLIDSGLKNVVAPHLIPSIIVPVRRLPVSTSLKVNKSSLKQLIHGLSREQLESLAASPSSTTMQTIRLKPLPLTQVEESVRGILSGVLGIEPSAIGSTDGFLDVGGDEVLAAKLVVACRHAGINLSIADVLRNATLTELCRSITTTDDSTLPEPYSPVDVLQSTPQQRGSSTEAFIQKVLAPKLGVDRKSVKEVADTSAMQTRYIESGMLRGRANIDYFTFTFSGGIDGNRLEEACQMLGTIHPILRTAFTPHNRRVYQAVLKSFSVAFERHSCPAWKVSSTTKKVIGQDQTAPIAFNKPMTKFIFVDGGKQSTLILRLSKAQHDDLSIALLVKDLKRLYDNNDNPPRRPSYCEFVRSIAHSNSDDAQQYWQKILEGGKMTQVIQHAKPYRLTVHVKTLRHKMLVGSLSNLGISFETVLKSAWAMVLASLSASADVLFGEIIDGRHVRLSDGHSVASVMGPTINTIPVRIQFPDTPLSPLELLQYVHGQRIAGIPHENMGFLDIVERCTPWPYWTRFSTVVQHQHETTTIIPGEPKAFHLGSASCVLDVLESMAKDVYDFSVHSIMRGQGRVELGLTFCTDRVPEELAEHALRLLSETVNMLTSVSIMQPVVPSAHQYRAMQKRIPLPPRPPSSGAGSTTALSPSETEHYNFSSLIPPYHARTIQTAISKAWATTLNPKKLGVPDEHIHRAAFFDLWGSLIPAAQLAAQLNRALPKLGLPGLDTSAPILSMENIIDHPTMLMQFELIAGKMLGNQTIPQHHTPLSASGSETTLISSTRRKPSMSVSSSAANVAKSLRRIASTIAHSTPAATTPVPATEANAVVPVLPSISPGSRPTEISPLTPAPQLPLLPHFSPVAPDIFTTPTPTTATTTSPPQPPHVSPNPSSAESMTTSSTASSSSTRHSSNEGRGQGEGEEAEAGERADVLGPLRSEVAGRVRLLTQGLGLQRGGGEVKTGGGGEELVSPLSAASGRSGRFWEGRGR
ncbi:non-ribosomal peptide synthetase [Coniochaeta sp. 2T2.1]|nr:non-ribosomal peptide synthetase [Coniochaeta sp. 2T2.1]